MDIKPKTGVRNYAKGGHVQHLARGGSAFVNPDEYPGWPQMAGIDGPHSRQQAKQPPNMAQEESAPAEAPQGGGGLGRRSGKGTAFVDENKYPGWPQMAPFS